MRYLITILFLRIKYPSPSPHPRDTQARGVENTVCTLPSLPVAPITKKLMIYLMHRPSPPHPPTPYSPSCSTIVMQLYYAGIYNCIVNDHRHWHETQDVSFTKHHQACVCARVCVYVCVRRVREAQSNTLSLSR